MFDNMTPMQKKEITECLDELLNYIWDFLNYRRISELDRNVLFDILHEMIMNGYTEYEISRVKLKKWESIISCLLGEYEY